MNVSSTADQDPVPAAKGPGKSLHGWTKLPPDQLKPKEIVKEAEPVRGKDER